MKGLKLYKVGKRFGDFWAVRDVSAIVLPGKITAFVGPNGAGKTTLFHLITGDLRPDTGKVFYDGKEITGLSPWRIARLGIGKLFQDVRIFQNLKVIENVIVALQDERSEGIWYGWTQFYKLGEYRKNLEQEAMHWLEFVGLVEHSDKLARELSFGQQKLLSFARLMAKGFDFLLLDEPTAGVHPRMIRRIVNLLRDLVEEHRKTIAIIEHNMSVIEDLADWVHFMNEGTIAFSGRTDHVLGAVEVRKTYIGL